MVYRYTPKAGDIVWLDFDPQAGHEHSGHRPALVISPSAYNRKTNLMLCCPMTTRVKGYPFEVSTAGDDSGVILADQVKSLDWVVHGAKPRGKVSSVELAEVRAKIFALAGKSSD
uniref:mRNA interferase MazF n=1 Tax=Candidatus Kentrum sp. FW TaxID=2126338 RepID=A0A450SIH0_9GAMM|nr:MAG: mRNA interferase MazF [Candidatus Kentron sp. FW]VFJ55675.1 MAG: mRNA interferase MazF [Candidatus Kentron sp. FW]